MIARRGSERGGVAVAHSRPDAVNAGRVAVPKATGLDWSIGLIVASSLAGESPLPVAHVKVHLQHADGGKTSSSMELTLPELRQLRLELQAALDALDRS